VRRRHSQAAAARHEGDTPPARRRPRTSAHSHQYIASGVSLQAGDIWRAGGGRWAGCACLAGGVRRAGGGRWAAPKCWARGRWAAEVGRMLCGNGLWAEGSWRAGVGRWAAAVGLAGGRRLAGGDVRRDGNCGRVVVGRAADSRCVADFGRTGVGRVLDVGGEALGGRAVRGWVAVV